MTSVAKCVWLFSYGTLQLHEVELATFGRLLQGDPDALFGYALQPLHITDKRVADLSGADVHTSACRTSRPTRPIAGFAFKVTEAELKAADQYEVDAYERVFVQLASGCQAYVYVGPPVE